MGGNMTWEQAVIALRRDPGKKALIAQCYYDDPLSAVAERFYRGEEWAAVRTLLRPTGRVLDVGAGRGIASYAFCKEGCEVTALEPDPSPIVGAQAIRELGKDAGCTIDVIEQVAERIARPDAFFDIVYGRAILHHIFDLGLFLREVKRLLKPKGVFLFTREHVISKIADKQDFLDSHPLHSGYGGEDALLLREYIVPIISAGLKVTRVFGPFENPINRYPMSNKDFERLVIESAARIVPRALAKAVGRLQWVQKGYGRFLTIKSKVPGRLFSFLGEKGNE
jgi:SAM-dependent methyltransferase